MVGPLNHVAIAAPRNGTSAHVADPSTGTVLVGSVFTPTAGRLLLCLAYGSVTSGSTTGVPAAPPTGWSEPASNTGEAVNNGGLYLWHKTAVGAGGDTATVNHNASNHPIVFEFFEFAAGSTMVGSASSTGVSTAGGAGPTLGSLTGSNWIAFALGVEMPTGQAVRTWTWSTGTELVDASEVFSTTPGYGYSLAYLEDSVLTSASSAATASPVYGTTAERLTFAVNAVPYVPPADPVPALLESGMGYILLEDGTTLLL